MYCKIRYAIILNCLLSKSGFIWDDDDETFEDHASSIIDSRANN